MVLVFRWIIVVLILLGNIAFWVHLFNRINSTGLPRKQIKLIEKLVVAVCLLIPGIVLWSDRVWLTEFLGLAGSNAELVLNFEAASGLTLSFGIGGIAALLWHAPSWFVARYRLQRSPPAVLQTTAHRADLRSVLGNDVYSKRWVKSIGILPGNQLHLIETTCHEVRIDRLDPKLDGLQIGHLSDIHLTGYMHFKFYREAVDRLMSTKPDMIVLSGDLIDYDHCLELVQPLLEPAQAISGCYFVLGNHERRLKNVGRLRSMLVELGWHDLGARSKCTEIAGEDIFLVGSERPWFENPDRNQHELESANDRMQAALRIGVSHSPDQIGWAKKLELDLLFCGHTHGGQVRLPWIGPIVAPSRFGSRYASGWFDCTPTLMHVSRGLSGTHPLRIACTPEVSSIVLRTRESGNGLRSST